MPRHTADSCPPACSASVVPQGRHAARSGLRPSPRPHCPAPLALPTRAGKAGGLEARLVHRQLDLLPGGQPQRVQVWPVKTHPAKVAEAQRDDGRKRTVRVTLDAVCMRSAVCRGSMQETGGWSATGSVQSGQERGGSARKERLTLPPPGHFLVRAVLPLPGPRPQPFVAARSAALTLCSRRPRPSWRVVHFALFVTVVPCVNYRILPFPLNLRLLSGFAGRLASDCWQGRVVLHGAC